MRPPFGNRSVRVTAGLEHVGVYQKTPVSQRQYCEKMRRSFDDQSPSAWFGGRFAATLPRLTFNPGLHVNYARPFCPCGTASRSLRIFQPSSADSGQQIAE